MNQPLSILCVLPVNDRHKQLLEAAAPANAVFHYANQSRVSAAEVAEAEIILGNVPPALIAKADRLIWLQTNSAGVGQYCAEDVLRPETQLTCASGAYGLAISEFMLAQTLCLMKKLHTYRAVQPLHKWKDYGTMKSIWNSTVLVVGLGDIGGEFAKRCSALGAYTIGVRRSDPTKPDYLDELHFVDELDALLPRADVVAISLPGTAATKNLFDARRLALMKQGALLLNVGRGMVVDTDALTEALRSGQLGGAALDVTRPEPLPPEHPLWDEPNALITPHASGNYSLPETFERVVRIAADNLARFAAGTSLRNQIDRSTQYRKAK